MALIYYADFQPSGCNTSFNVICCPSDHFCDKIFKAIDFPTARKTLRSSKPRQKVSGIQSHDIYSVCTVNNEGFSMFKRLKKIYQAIVTKNL